MIVILLGANGLYAERWMGHVEAAAQRADAGELQVWQRSNRPMWSATIAAFLTLAVVFVMVVKPTIF